MFNVGELIIYSAHGICRIDDICEKTYFGVTKNFYILHPIVDHKLTICTPVDNNKVVMLELLSKEEAEEILESFRMPGIVWIETESERNQIYYDIVKKGDRKKIAMIANTLMRKKIEIENNRKKVFEKDKQLLTSIQNILFAELALTLKTTLEEIQDKIMKFINGSNVRIGGDNK